MAYGTTAQSSARTSPTRREYRCLPTANRPHAAIRDATQSTSRPATTYDTGSTSATARIMPGNSGKNARLVRCEALTVAVPGPWSKPWDAMLTYADMSNRWKICANVMLVCSAHSHNTVMQMTRSAA